MMDRVAHPIDVRIAYYDGVMRIDEYYFMPLVLSILGYEVGIKNSEVREFSGSLFFCHPPIILK
jgi:hypothetical protein